MISILLSGDNPEEINRIKDFTAQALATRCNEKSQIITSDSSDLKKALSAELMDLAVVVMDTEKDIPQAVKVRERFGGVYLMISADSSIAPDKYIRPDIMAASLMLRPCEDAHAMETIERFITSFLSQRVTEDAGSYKVETRSGIVSIPYDRICYIESRNKKISIRLDREEYECYSTLEGVKKEFPDYFVQCHRGFIVNGKRVKEASKKDMEFIMDNGMTVPVSRSYRSVMKEVTG